MEKEFSMRATSKRKQNLASGIELQVEMPSHDGEFPKSSIFYTGPNSATTFILNNEELPISVLKTDTDGYKYSINSDEFSNGKEFIEEAIPNYDKVHLKDCLNMKDKVSDLYFELSGIEDRIVFTDYLTDWSNCNFMEFCLHVSILCHKYRAENVDYKLAWEKHDLYFRGRTKKRPDQGFYMIGKKLFDEGIYTNTNRMNAVKKREFFSTEKSFQISLINACERKGYRFSKDNL